MSSQWRQRFFHWTIYLLLVGYAPALGLTWWIFHHPLGGVNNALAAALLVALSAAQAQKETRSDKAPGTKAAAPVPPGIDGEGV